MVKSRHRRPLQLPPLRLPLHATRLGIIRLRIQRRAGWIQRPASSMANAVRGLEGSSPSQQQQRRRHRSLQRRRRKSASVWDNCEICRYYDAHKHEIDIVSSKEDDALGGPGDIADRNVVEANKINTAQASKTPPLPPTPPDYSNCPGEFKSLGTDRLLPPNDLNDPSDLKEYKVYLEKFYCFHKGPGPSESDAAIADAASKCLEKEKTMKFLWDDKDAFSCVGNDFILRRRIMGEMRTAIAGRGEHLPYAVDAGPCIAKEAELITEWLTKWGPALTNEEYVLCHNIRWYGYVLFDMPVKWSIHIAAALLGIQKEAELLIENLKHGSVESTSTSMKIRQSALDFIRKMYVDEYCLPICGERSEVAPESDDAESDDDVSAIEEDDTAWFVTVEELDYDYKKKLLPVEKQLKL